MDESTVAPKPQRAAQKKPPEISVKFLEYPRISPGVYSVVGKSIQGPEWVRAYGSWRLRVEFETLSGDGPVSRFFNLGNNPDGPHAARRSMYLAWWSAANGEPLKRGQVPSADVFLDGQVFTVRVDDSRSNSKREAKRDDEIYSRVTELHAVNGKPISRVPKPESLSLKPEVIKPEVRKAASTQTANQPNQDWHPAASLREPRAENAVQAASHAGRGVVANTHTATNPKSGGSGPRSGKAETKWRN
jgi:hypothetical protein